MCLYVSLCVNLILMHNDQSWTDFESNVFYRRSQGSSVFCPLISELYTLFRCSQLTYRGNFNLNQTVRGLVFKLNQVAEIAEYCNCAK